MTEETSSNKKRTRIAFGVIILVIIIIFAAIFGIPAYFNAKMAKEEASMIPHPQTVTAVTTKSSTWVPKINVAGNAAAMEGIEVTAQASGLVTNISFSTGDKVKKGQELFRLNTQELEAELENAIAVRELAEITYLRYKDLVEQQATSFQNYDTAAAEYAEAKAEVKTVQANIDYHIVKAPFDGMMGLRNISLGQYFNMGDNAALLTMVNPIYINFQVPQNYLSDVKVGGDIEFTSDSYPGKTFKAKITGQNSAISASSSQLQIQATYKNDDTENLILPGMYLNVSIVLPKVKNAIVLPRNAVSFGLYGNIVYILEPVMENGQQKMAEYSTKKNGSLVTVKTESPLYTVNPISVTTSYSRGNDVVVNDLKPGMIIASSGQNKLQKGTKAIVDNSVNFSPDKQDQLD
jgi:membrane fusion protein (multidrug efflux system)